MAVQQSVGLRAYCAAMASAWCRSTETSWETPRSAMVTPNSRSMRAMVTGLWVMAMKRVSVRRAHLVQHVAEAVDVGVVQRRVHLVEHADRRRLGQEHARRSAPWRSAPARRRSSGSWSPCRLPGGQA